MQYHCAEHTQSFSQTTNALEAVLAARIINRRSVYVEERTDYGAVVLYGVDYSNRCAASRAIQPDLYSNCPSRYSLYLYLWHIPNGVFNEYGPAVFAKKLNMELWSILRHIL